MKKYILIAIMLTAAYNMFCCDMAGAVSTNGSTFEWNYDLYWHCCRFLNTALNGCTHTDGRAVVLHDESAIDGITAVREHDGSSLNDSWRVLIPYSTVMLNHARVGSSGSDETAFHPFIWESRLDDKIYTFMANGTIDENDLVDLLTEGSDDDWLNDAFEHLHSHPDNVDVVSIENICDSEFYFYWLIKNIEANRDIKKGLEHALYSLNAYTGTSSWKNFMFSDGDDLYLYKRGSDPSDYDHRIYYGQVIFHPDEDPETTEYIDAYVATTQNVTRDYDGNYNYYEPLPVENELNNGDLVVIKGNGTINTYPNFDSSIPEVNYIAVNGVNWKCFPVDYSGYTALTQLEETQYYTPILFHYNYGGIGYSNWRQFSTIDLEYTRGYKLSLSNVGGNGIQYDSKGVHVLEDREIPLDSQQNRFWIPYFIQEKVSPYEAFEDIIDSAVQIQAQYWVMWRKTTYSAWQVAMYPGSNGLYCYYGKMYDVTLVSGHPTVMDYYGMTGSIGLTEYIPPETEYYTFSEDLEYEAILIDTIVSNDPIEEVAVFEGEECIGASVFEGYPVFLRAFTSELNRDNEPLEFRIYTGSRSEPDVAYRVYDEDFAYYRDESMYPHQNVITRVCLGLNGEEMPVMSDNLVRMKQYPDPFNPETAIEYSIPEAGNVNIAIYNIKGQKVKSLLSSEQSAGLHKVIWNGNDDKGRRSASGIYFYVLKYNEQIVRDKMLMIK